eukprot:1401968-Rhodomonas_salina.2
MAQQSPAPQVCPCYAMSGTDIAYAAATTSYACAARCPVPANSAIGLRTRYALSGTETDVSGIFLYQTAAPICSLSSELSGPAT